MFGFGKKKNDAHAATEREQGAVAAAVESEEKETAAEEAPAEATQGGTQQPTAQEEPVASFVEFTRDHGPFDITEQRTGSSYIDLGGLLVKSNPGLNLRLEVDQKTQQVIAVTLQLGEGTLQVQAFAAPKSRGIWDEIRKELSESVRRQGGQVDIKDGPFGRQLISRVPAELPDGRKGFRIARFVGVDGPRWFVRGVFSGKAVLPGESATALEEVFRTIVVNRGSDPMPPRDLLPMRVPQNIQDAAAQAAAAAQAEKKPTVEVPRRGPEITEIG
ncbi:MAG TPA: DUF3710 domain-containing protein [Candidatus Rothia avicola]|uniref:DUF3710 domain-containing protein n=1 Tax=Candidatus Rothia avicola TaxID=2840478 RepID=A0A9D2CS60_9MICC|nr:DUF3710 domain-containing protein [Candidatus Rothia avicola]